MRLSCDLHLHSCLSPCGDNDMTPYNLVNMAALLELDIIALTDHNSCGNCDAAIRTGKEAGVLVVPGMELCTAEEIHMVCLFETVERSEAFAREVRATLPPIKNRPDIYGRQLYMDAEDSVLGEEDTLLIAASSIRADQAPALVAKHGGVCYPAHIDRPSFSITVAFGVFPPDMGFTCAELSAVADESLLRNEHPALNDIFLLRASDAHSLEQMRAPDESQFFELPEKSSAAILDFLRRGGKPRDK